MVAVPPSTAVAALVWPTSALFSTTAVEALTVKATEAASEPVADDLGAADAKVGPADRHDGSGGTCAVGREPAVAHVDG